MSLCPGDLIENLIGKHASLVCANYHERHTGNWTGNWTVVDIVRLTADRQNSSRSHVIKFDCGTKPSLQFIGWKTVAKSKDEAQ